MCILGCCCFLGGGGICSAPHSAHWSPKLCVNVFSFLRFFLAALQLTPNSPPPPPNPRCLLSPPFPPFAARVGPAVGPQGPGLRVRRLPLRIRQGPGPGHQGEGFVRVQPHHRYGRPLGASQAASSPSSRFIHRCNVDESLTSHTDQGGYRAKYRRKSSSDLSRSSASWPWVKNPSGYYYPCYEIC